MGSSQVGSAQAVATSTMMAKILVPHDGTEASDKALAKAIELAKPFNSEIIILNVVDDRFVPPSVTLAFLSDKTPLETAKEQVIKYLKQGAEAMLKDQVEKVKSQGLKVRFVLAVGSPSEEIAKVAQNEGVGLIVMGSRQSKIKEKLGMLGSVSKSISEIAPCPVLIVR